MESTDVTTLGARRLRLGRNRSGPECSIGSANSGILTLVSCLSPTIVIISVRQHTACIARLRAGDVLLRLSGKLDKLAVNTPGPLFARHTLRSGKLPQVRTRTRFLVPRIRHLIKSSIYPRVRLGQT